MSIKAVDHSVNIIGIEKNGRKYAMCVAWAAQVAEDRLICAIGPQSATGKVIEKGDIIGFSNLTKEQMNIAFQIGDINKHSDTVDKLTGIEYRTDDSAIIIQNAKTEIKGKVVDILRLPGIESENIVYIQIIDGKENAGKALHISDMSM